MQATIKFQCHQLKLPIHYNHIIQGFIYKNISNESFRTFLHEEGFKREKRKFKFFSFSNMEGRYVLDKENKMIIFPNEFSITVASLVDDFINDLLKTCLFSNQLEINHYPVKVIGVDIEEPRKFSNRILVKTISPVVTYSTISIEGKKRTIYHNPNDSIFPKQIKENLLKKADILGDHLEDRNLIIQPAENKRIREHIILYKGTVIKGWNGIFEMNGDHRLLEIALSCGIGSKNSQGFGCIKMIRAL